MPAITIREPTRGEQGRHCCKSCASEARTRAYQSPTFSCTLHVQSHRSLCSYDRCLLGSAEFIKHRTVQARHLLFAQAFAAAPSCRRGAAAPLPPHVAAVEPAIEPLVEPVVVDFVPRVQQAIRSFSFSHLHLQHHCSVVLTTVGGVYYIANRERLRRFRLWGRRGFGCLCPARSRFPVLF